MQKLLEKIESAQAAYTEAVATKPQAHAQKIGAEVKALRQELAAKIAEGAVPCSVRWFVDRAAGLVPGKGCGNLPHGIMQPNGFEICCLACGDARPRAHRPRGLFREQAVAAWNDEHDPSTRDAAIKRRLGGVQ